MTRSRKRRSSRNAPSAVRCPRSALVAAMMRQRDWRGALPAHRIELPLLHHPEELGLEHQARVPDLVQEERPFPGDLETPLPVGCGAGEGPPHVPEELGLQECLGNGRAIHRDERLVRRGRVFVDGAGDELLARSGLAADQDRRSRAGHGPDELVDVPHPPVVADDDPRPAPGRRARPPRVDGSSLHGLVPQAPLHDRVELVQVQRLHEVVVGAALHRVDGRLHVVVRGHQDHVDVGTAAPDLVQHLEPGDAGHADVGQDELGGEALDAGEAVFSGSGRTHLVPAEGQVPLQRPPV